MAILYMPKGLSILDGSVVWSDVKGDRVLRWHNNKVGLVRLSKKAVVGSKNYLEALSFASS